MAVLHFLLILLIFPLVRPDVEPDTSQYHRYKVVEATFKQYARDNPTLAKVYTIGKSFQGR